VPPGGKVFVNEFTSSGTVGWFKAVRSREVIELIRANPNAFILTYVIAHRARFHDGFNADGLERGEAMLGDFESYGMTERQYRTAKEQLTKWHFATFKTTNKGTLGKLMDTRLFDPLNIQADGQNDTRPTDKRRAADGQPTTNKEGKKETRKQGTGKTGVGSQARRHLPSVESRPETFQELEQFAAKKGFERDVAERFARYNDLHDWPVNDWRGAFVRFAEMATDSPGGVSSVPEDWNPEILR
jgi:hypothetical protein